MFVCSLTFGQSSFISKLEEHITAAESTPEIVLLRKNQPEIFESNDCPPAFDLKALVNEESALPELKVEEKIQEELLDLLFRYDCDRFLSLNILGQLYFPKIDRALEQYQLPAYYRYLPILLTGFQSDFREKNRAGLLGLSYLEASMNNIKVLDSIDYRYILNYSSLSFSKELNRRRELLGDELLVLCSYKEGIMPVRQRMNESSSPSEFLALCSQESKEWLMAFKLLSDYFINLEVGDFRHELVKLEDEFQEVEVKRTSSIDSYTTILDIEESDLRLLNPWAVGDIIPVSDDIKLRLPRPKAEEFIALEDSIYNYAEKLAELKRKEEEKRREEQERIRKQEEILHTVRSGEVLGIIAEQYGVSVRDIKSWNSLRRDMIYVGQKLSIYGTERRIPRAQVEEPTPEVDPNGDALIYTVRSGDSLWLIARKYPGVSAENIMEWNKITEDLQPGQKIKIYNVE